LRTPVGQLPAVSDQIFHFELAIEYQYICKKKQIGRGLERHGAHLQTLPSAYYSNALVARFLDGLRTSHHQKPNLQYVEKVSLMLHTVNCRTYCPHYLQQMRRATQIAT